MIAPVLYLMAFLAAGALLMGLTQGMEKGRWSLLVVWAIVLALLFSVSGCASTPATEPEPPPMPAPILCAAPAGMTQAESAPEIPRGEITQRDVAVYLLDLHRWGSRGWLRLSGVRAHANQCASNARPPDLYTAIQEH